MTVLLLRLSGPMQSWGSRSRFDHRDTEREPTKSGVIGLLCAALGKPRVERKGDGFPTLEQLSALSFGVRVDREGILRRDFQTAGGGKWLGKEYGVARADGTKGETVTSERFFLSDAVFLAGFEGDDSLLIQRLDAALARPAWPVFLGRKSFPPSEPVRLNGGSIREGPLAKALTMEPWLPRLWKNPPSERPERLRVVMECKPGEGGDWRQDVPVSFEMGNRRHGVRYVREFFVPTP